MPGRPRAYWTFDPREGSVHCAVMVPDPAEFQFIAERGYVVIDGQPADVVNTHDPAQFHAGEGFMRLQFREPYRRQEQGGEG